MRLRHNLLFLILTASTVSADEKTSLRQTSQSGFSGWTEAAGKHSKGQWMNGTLKIRKDGEAIQSFRSHYAFIIGWSFARGDTAVVVQSQNSHGPYYWQMFDITSGKQLAAFFEVQEKWPEWVIDFTKAD